MKAGEPRRQNGKTGGTKHEPFHICPQCQNFAAEFCETCQGQGYIPEDWEDLHDWTLDRWGT